MICSQCAREGTRLVGKTSYPSDCSSCIAESLIYGDNHPMGIMTYERAAKHCSCLANNHEGEIISNKSPKFDKIAEDHKNQLQEEEETRREANFVEEQKRQEAIEYYTNRVAELKKLDESGPEWILKEKHNG